MPLYRQPYEQTILDVLGTRITDTENLITTLSVENASLLARIAALESNFSHPGYIPGRYYQGTNLIYTDTANAGVFSTTHITYFPFPIYEDVEIARLAVYANTAVSLADINIGIYSNVNKLPRDLIASSGVLPCTSAGVKEGVVLANLQRGWYWMGGITSKVPSLQCGTGYVGLNHLLGQASPTATSATCSLRNSYFSGTLPTIAPIDNLTSVTGNYMPLFWLKVA